MSSTPTRPEGLGGAVPVLEIGGSHVTAALVDLARAALVPGSTYRDPLDGSGAAEDILGSVAACASRLGAPRGAHWGVAIPGPFDYEQGVGLFVGVAKFESLRDVDVGTALVRVLPGPPAAVKFLNDAEAFLRGEWLFGSAAGHRRCAGITLGTGVGSAFLADGTACTEGPLVPPGGEVHHLYIDGRPLEDTVSTRALRSAYASRTGALVDHVGEIARRARQGDSLAKEMLHIAFEKLGATLRPWFDRFNATAVVMGGSMTGSWALIGPAFVTGLNSQVGRPIRYAVSVAKQPREAALLGAADHVRRSIPADVGRSVVENR